jgi:hypothetical protein
VTRAYVLRPEIDDGRRAGEPPARLLDPDGTRAHALSGPSSARDLARMLRAGAMSPRRGRRSRGKATLGEHSRETGDRGERLESRRGVWREFASGHGAGVAARFAGKGPRLGRRTRAGERATAATNGLELPERAQRRGRRGRSLAEEQTRHGGEHLDETGDRGEPRVVSGPRSTTAPRQLNANVGRDSRGSSIPPSHAPTRPSAERLELRAWAPTARDEVSEGVSTTRSGRRATAVRRA